MSSNPTQESPSTGSRASSQVLPLEYEANRPRTHFRWWILGLIFFGTTINYVDRQVMNTLASHLIDLFKLSKTEWGAIGMTFGLSYGVGQMISGKFLDKVGVRIGYPLGLFLWSVVSILTAWSVGFGHALAGTLGSMFGIKIGGAALGFGVMRGLLGFSEAPNFPAATKTLSEWFPKKERALAMGWVNAGTNIGILIALAVVSPITHRFGWQYAFIVTGLLGLLWLFFWIPIYRPPQSHPRVSKAELDYIHSDPPEPTAKVLWRTLLTFPQAWAFIIAKFITDAMWWFYMVWFVVFLKDQYGLDLNKIGLPLIVVFLMADVGSIGGGWISSRMLHHGSTVNKARKTALFICALMVFPICFAAWPSKDYLWISIFILGVATAGHQGFSSNLYTLVSDTFPRRAVASVAGLGGMFGYIGGAIFSYIVGRVLDANKNQYMPIFVVAGVAYLVALLIIHLLMPRLQPALVDDRSIGHGFEPLPPKAS